MGKLKEDIMGTLEKMKESVQVTYHMVYWGVREIFFFTRAYIKIYRTYVISFL